MTSMFAKRSACLCHYSYFVIQDAFRWLRCLQRALHACVITHISLYRMNLGDFDDCKALCMPVSLLIFRQTGWIGWPMFAKRSAYLCHYSYFVIQDAFRWLRCLQSALHACVITHISLYRMHLGDFDVCKELCMPVSLLIFRYTGWI